MVHTYEVLVNFKEFEQVTDACQNGTMRYEVDAESVILADRIAKTQAKNDHPSWTECDVRVTRLLR